MKRAIYIVCFAACVLFVTCKKTIKKEDIHTPPLKIPVPFVEYRSSFAGAYQGVYSKISARTMWGNSLPNDTIAYDGNSLSQVTLSTGNDSSLKASLPLREFHMNANGKWVNQSRKCVGCPDSLYRVTLRNDSFYLFISYNSGSHPNTIYYYTSFRGKKQ